MYKNKFSYPVDLSPITSYMGKADGFSSEAIAEFESKAERDYNTIKDWILPEYRSVLDIGSGLGGVDILIGNETNIRTINIMDGDGTVEKTSSYRDDTSAWCDRKIAWDLISRNVPFECIVKDYPPDSSLTIPVDLVISLKSWGHHYPVAVYLPLVERSLAPGGRVIMDIRHRRGNGLQYMQDHGFQRIGATYETPKCLRMVFERTIKRKRLHWNV
jgi:SAM-dependent methyltransferase